MYRMYMGLFLVAASTLLLAGCQNVTRELRHFPELFNPRVNLTEYNYGAADSLVSQARADLSLSMPIGMGVLNPTNLRPGEKIPPFGSVVSDQVGSRLVQLGYNVRDLGRETKRIAERSERAFLALAKDEGTKALITGNYTISDYDVLINLRLVGVESGRVWASVDYRVPLGSDTYSVLNRDPFFSLPMAPADNPEWLPPGTPEEEIKASRAHGRNLNN